MDDQNVIGDVREAIAKAEDEPCRALLNDARSTPPL